MFLSFDLNSQKVVTVLSARGSEFQSLGAVTEKDRPPIEDRQNVGTQRSSELEDNFYFYVPWARRNIRRE